MADEQIADAVALAIQLEDNEQIKEAYFAFTSASQKAITALNEIKFVHSSIISCPKQHSSLISSIQTCLTHIENIIDNHSPTATNIQNPISRQTTGDSQKGPRPPLPPKPSRMQKPVIPPKPQKVPSPTTSTTATTHLNSIELQDNSLPAENKYQHDATIIRPRVQYEQQQQSRPLSLQVPSVVQSRPTSDSSSNRRPRTEYQQQQEQNETSVRIVAEGEVDPDYLVPAQTNAGDSLAPASLSTMNIDHIPLIPAPPLLTTHRLLQQKLDELDEKIRTCRTKKQAITNGQQQLQPQASLDIMMTEENLDQMIAQYLRVMAELKVNLNSVRTIYMSAATIPTVLQFQAHVIAYQITLIEAAIFSAIPPHALLQHSSKSPHPRIVASTDFFNYITRCIEHSILLSQEASSRAQLIHYWIKVASRCFDINNYQTLKAIISALNTPPVQRLKRTWAYIPKKSSTKLETLNDLMSEANNYGAYREHMGMVSTMVVNGKSVQLIRDEHYSRPTVPFLGTFIHDITYLLAAFKSSGKNSPADEEPRIHDVLNTMRRFQVGPRYTPSLPANFLKSSQKHHFRPAISNAIHRGASRIQRISGFGSGAGAGNSGSGGTNSIMGLDNSSGSGNNSSTNLSSYNSNERSNMQEEDATEDGNLEEQQKMATQYILMRPWVSQNTVDELSHLREPPQPKSNSLYGARSSSSGPSTTSMNRTSSVFSSGSRFSTGSLSLNTISTSTAGGESRPSSMDEHIHDEDERKRISNGSGGFFSSFRRSESGNLASSSSRPVTIHEGQENAATPGLSREENENFHVLENIKRSTWDESGSSSNAYPMAVPPQIPANQKAPIVPPRPVPPRPEASQQASHNDEFKAALAQRLAKVAERHNDS